MVNKILTASGIKFKETRFLKPPTGCAYAIFMDDADANGADDMAVGTIAHAITVELYAPRPEPQAEAEKAIQSALSAAGLKYHKQPRYWIQEEQLYQTIYEFSYTEKI